MQMPIKCKIQPRLSGPKTFPAPKWAKRPISLQRVTLLLLGELRLPHIGQKPRVRRAVASIVCASLIQAEVAVHGQANLRGVRVVLTVVLPPTHRAQGQSARRIKCLRSAARAAITILHGFHWLDGRKAERSGLQRRQIAWSVCARSRPNRSFSTLIFHLFPTPLSVCNFLLLFLNLFFESREGRHTSASARRRNT